MHQGTPPHPSGAADLVRITNATCAALESAADRVEASLEVISDACGTVGTVGFACRQELLEAAESLSRAAASWRRQARHLLQMALPLQSGSGDRGAAAGRLLLAARAAADQLRSEVRQTLCLRDLCRQVAQPAG